MKKLILAVLLAAVTFCSASCGQLIKLLDMNMNERDSDSDYSYENDASGLKEDTTYYNGHLGVSYTIPKGWWVYDIDEYNFTQSPNASTDEENLNVELYEYYDYIYMGYIGNRQYSSRDDHIGIDLSAERPVEDITYEEYLESFEAYMLDTEREDSVYTVRSRGDVVISDRTFRKFVFYVSRTEDSNYFEDAYVAPVGNGYYLVIYASYWEDYAEGSQKAQEAIEKAVAFIEGSSI